MLISSFFLFLSIVQFFFHIQKQKWVAIQDLVVNQHVNNQVVKQFVINHRWTSTSVCNVLLVLVAGVVSINVAALRDNVVTMIVHVDLYAVVITCSKNSNKVYVVIPTRYHSISIVCFLTHILTDDKTNWLSSILFRYFCRLVIWPLPSLNSQWHSLPVHWELFTVPRLPHC